jgi:hypothetical protein
VAFGRRSRGELSSGFYWVVSMSVPHPLEVHIHRLVCTAPDWGAAWQQIQVRTVAALATLREEVEALST